MNYDLFMTMALEQAEQALDDGDFPVGCVIVRDNHVIASGRRTNTRENARNEIDHAEITALRQLSGLSTDFDREEMVLFSTMEPCLMCFAAIMLSGIRHIVYAYEDVMGGGVGCERTSLPPLYRDSDMKIVSGVLRKESLALFKRFFLRPENTYWKGSCLERYSLSAS